jgi:glycine hydroxymethyltransferase
MIPNDARSALSPSGIRIGTPALTTRGCTTDDMKKIAEYLDIALQNTENNDILQSL